MKIKYPKQIAIYVVLFLVVIAASVFIFVNKGKHPTTADSVTSSGTFSFSGDSAKTVGDTVNIAANLNTGGNLICLATFTITYPADLLQFQTSSFGSIFSEPQNIETAISAGSIHYMLSPKPSCTSSNTTLLNMTFTAKAVGSANLAFSVGDLIGGEVDGMQPITSTTSGKTVVIAAAETPPAVNSNQNSNVAAPPPTANSNQNSNVAAPPPTANSNQNSNINSNANKNSNKNGNTNKNTALNNSTNSAPPAATNGLTNPVLSKVEYSSDAILDNVQAKAKGIVFSGTSDPSVKVNIVIASDPISVSAQSDASGNWTYTLGEWLDAGVHTASLISEKDALKSTEIKTNFVIGTAAKDQIAIGITLPTGEEAVSAPTSETKSTPWYRSIPIIIGAFGVLLVVVLLVIFISKRRHYLKVTQEITGSMQANANSSHQPVDNSMITSSSDLLSPQKPDGPIIQSMPGPSTKIKENSPFSVPSVTDEIKKPVDETNPLASSAEENEPVSSFGSVQSPASEQTSTELNKNSSNENLPNQAVISPVTNDSSLSSTSDTEVVPSPEPQKEPVFGGIESPEIKKEEMTIGYGQEMSSQPKPTIETPGLSETKPAAPVINDTPVSNSNTNGSATIPEAPKGTPVNKDTIIAKKIEALVEPEITFDQEYIEQDSVNQK